MNDNIGDRMKNYENAECGRRFMSLLPILARIDGRAFHSFTKGMNRPYDIRFSNCMVETAKYLAKETNAAMAYTQSDEITLAWHSTDIKSQIWFDGRIAKMTSQLAAQATAFFYREIGFAGFDAKYLDKMPTFDARVWQVPNRTEAANCFLWREWDATKNSISMAASSVYSNKELFGKNGSQKQEMLFQKGINWNDYPAFFKRGTYIQKCKVSTPFSEDELEDLPPKHAARQNPELLIERTVWKQRELPILSTIINREDVIFNGANEEVRKGE